MINSCHQCEILIAGADLGCWAVSFICLFNLPANKKRKKKEKNFSHSLLERQSPPKVRHTDSCILNVWVKESIYVLSPFTTYSRGATHENLNLTQGIIGTPPSTVVKMEKTQLENSKWLTSCKKFVPTYTVFWTTHNCQRGVFTSASIPNGHDYRDLHFCSVWRISFAFLCLWIPSQLLTWTQSATHRGRSLINVNAFIILLNIIIIIIALIIPAHRQH